MKPNVIKFDNFNGLVKSVATPPHNTFEELINYRNDRMLGGLANRYGFANKLNIAYQPDAFVYTRFSDLGETLVIEGPVTGAPYNGNSKVEILPPVIPRNGTANTVLLDITTPLPDNTISTISYSSGLVKIVVNNTLAHTDSGFWIVYNQRTGQATVALSQSSGTDLYINTDVFYSSWIAGDTLSFFMGDLIIPTTGFARSILGLPIMQSIDAFNNIVLSGINPTLWIGRIGTTTTTRKYFGTLFHQTTNPTACGFEYSGVYVTKLIEDFTTGAFRTSLKHIDVKKDVTTTNTITLAPVSFVSSSGTWLDETSTPPANFWSKISDGSDATYVAAVQPANFIVGMTQVTPGLLLDKTGLVTLQANCWMGSSGGAYTTAVDLHIYESTTLLSTFRITMTGAINGSVKNFSFQMPAYYITDVNSLRFRMDVVSGTASGVVSEVRMILPLTPTTQGIDNTSTNPDYALNFSLELDGFNETPLIYGNAPYGDPTTSGSYVETCKIAVGPASTTNYIRARIKTPYSAIINRRITAIKIYGGVNISNVWVWRYCNKIELDNSQWKAENINGTICACIEIQIGNEINTGETYEDRLV